MQQNTSILFLSDFSDDLFILDETSIFYLLPLIRASLCKTGFWKQAVVHLSVGQVWFASFFYVNSLNWFLNRYSDNLASERLLPKEQRHNQTELKNPNISQTAFPLQYSFLQSKKRIKHQDWTNPDTSCVMWIFAVADTVLRRTGWKRSATNTNASIRCRVCNSFYGWLTVFPL